ncbi:hypothetical protein [Nocardiopsis suaedae]|uniref:AtpZ/AtpI family protein n=1 Tax=Nocardiopsis suaedae TaxID=3018444 RepID=A0ABT4TIH8_9ACTN|nr:hypothetical protein [Nocardiopsis suaedae]MDA2804487.1 hypothetical protein [Nocardiopsis suaedae]
MNERTDAVGGEEPPRANAGAVLSYLLGGLAFWGLIGWGVDSALGFDSLFLPIGLLLGLVGGIYLIITQYVRS